VDFASNFASILLGARSLYRHRRDGKGAATKDRNAIGRAYALDEFPTVKGLRLNVQAALCHGCRFGHNPIRDTGIRSGDG
jgi:hypothetical protein